MNKSMRNGLAVLLGTVTGMYIMVAPLATTYASPHQKSHTTIITKKIYSNPVNTQNTQNRIQDPVAAVKASAGKLGFSATADSFSLVSQTSNSAVVLVIHQGTSYQVTLTLNHSQWIVSSVKKVSHTKDTPSVPSSGTGNNGGTSTGTTTGGSSSTPTTGNSSTSGDVTAAEQQAVNLLNADRQANGLPSLAVDARLTTIARNHAQDMIDRNFFSHNNPDGQTPFDRMKQAGISYRSAGENIAEQPSVQAAETAFMNSSGHRANILNSSYTNVGIGVAYDKNGTAYVVQDFIQS